MSPRKPLTRAQRAVRVALRAELRERRAAHRTRMRVALLALEVNPSGQYAAWLADAEGRAAAAEWMLREACHDVTPYDWARPYRRLLAARQSKRDVTYYRRELRRSVRLDGPPHVRLLGLASTEVA